MSKYNELFEAIRGSIEDGKADLYEELLIDLSLALNGSNTDVYLKNITGLFELFKQERQVDGSQLYLTIGEIYSHFSEQNQKALDRYLDENKKKFKSESLVRHLLG